MGQPLFTRRYLDVKKAKELYDIGYCDPQIADMCDVSRDTVRDWRRRNGLEGHKVPYIEKTEEKPSGLAAMAAEANAHGMTYGQYMVARREGKV